MQARFIRFLAGSFMVGVGWQCLAEEVEPAASSNPDLTKLSLEELANYPITSVSKHEEKLSQASAAVSVITQEDIRRSGLTTIPELLLLVPGLGAARLTANQSAISSRGF